MLPRTPSFPPPPSPPIVEEVSATDPPASHGPGAPSTQPCVLPTPAAFLTFDDKGACSACGMSIMDMFPSLADLHGALKAMPPPTVHTPPAVCSAPLTKCGNPEHEAQVLVAITDALRGLTSADGDPVILLGPSVADAWVPVPGHELCQHFSTAHGFKDPGVGMTYEENGAWTAFLACSPINGFHRVQFSALATFVTQIKTPPIRHADSVAVSPLPAPVGKRSRGGSLKLYGTYKHIQSPYCMFNSYHPRHFLGHVFCLTTGAKVKSVTPLHFTAAILHSGYESDGGDDAGAGHRGRKRREVCPGANDLAE
jgi:hypothetical protein